MLSAMDVASVISKFRIKIEGHVKHSHHCYRTMNRQMYQSALKDDQCDNKHLQVTVGLTSGGVGFSFGVVGSRFTALGDIILEVAGVPDDAALLPPGPGFM